MLRQTGRTSAVSEIKVKGKVHHRGDVFEAKMQQLLNEAIDVQVPTGEYFKTQIERMKKATLPVVLGMDSKAKERVLLKMAGKLQQKDLPKDLARRFIDATYAQGSYETERNDVSTIIHESRTVYDLFNAIGREAKPLSIRHREAAEQIAYMLLNGSTSVL